MLIGDTCDLGGFLECDPFLRRLALHGITNARQRGPTSGMMPADGIHCGRSRRALSCRDSAHHVTPFRCLPGDEQQHLGAVNRCQRSSGGSEISDIGLRFCSLSCFGGSLARLFQGSGYRSRSKSLPRSLSFQ